MSNKEKIFGRAFALLQSTHPDSTMHLQNLLTVEAAQLMVDGTMTKLESQDMSKLVAANDS